MPLQIRTIKCKDLAQKTAEFRKGGESASTHGSPHRACVYSFRVLNSEHLYVLSKPECTKIATCLGQFDGTRLALIECWMNFQTFRPMSLGITLLATGAAAETELLLDTSAGYLEAPGLELSTRLRGDILKSEQQGLDILLNASFAAGFVARSGTSQIYSATACFYRGKDNWLISAEPYIGYEANDFSSRLAWPGARLGLEYANEANSYGVQYSREQWIPLSDEFEDWLGTRHELRVYWSATRRNPQWQLGIVTRRSVTSSTNQLGPEAHAIMRISPRWEVELYANVAVLRGSSDDFLQENSSGFGTRVNWSNRPDLKFHIGISEVTDGLTQAWMTAGGGSWSAL